MRASQSSGALRLRETRSTKTMAAPTARRPRRPAGTDLVGSLLGFLGLYLIALSLLMLVSPGTFFSEIAPFGAQNDHYIRDGATFQLALGVLALLAVRE